jgi:hypothetical protein
MSRLVNLGVFQVNSVNNNSMVTIGDASNGDTYKYQKFNMGFGVVLGSYNMMPANVNLVNDCDVADQNGSMPLLKPDFSTSITGTSPVSF